MIGKKEDRVEEERKIHELKLVLEKLKHKNKMMEIEAEIKRNLEYHKLELERVRIKSAEIRRSQERKMFRK